MCGGGVTSSLPSNEVEEVVTQSQVDKEVTIKPTSSASEQENATDSEDLEQEQNIVEVKGEKSEETKEIEKIENSDEQSNKPISQEAEKDDLQGVEAESPQNTVDEVKSDELTNTEITSFESDKSETLDGIVATSIDENEVSERFETRITKETLPTDDMIEVKNASIQFRSADDEERSIAVRASETLFENTGSSNSVLGVNVRQTIVPVYDRQGKYRVNVEVNNINNRGSRYVFNIENSKWMDSSLNMRELMRRIFNEIKAKDATAEVAVMLSRSNGAHILFNFISIDNALSRLNSIPTNVRTNDTRNFVSSLLRLKNELFSSDASKNYTNLNYIEIWSTGVGNSEWYSTKDINDPFFEQNPQIKHYILYSPGYNNPASAYGEKYNRYINAITYDWYQSMNTISGIVKGIVDKTKVGPASLDIELDPNVAVFERLEMLPTFSAQGTYANNHIHVSNISAGPKDKIGRNISFNYYIHTNPNTNLDTLQSVAKNGSYRLFSKSNETISLRHPKIAMPGITLNVERAYDSTVPENLKNPILFTVGAVANTDGISADKIIDEKILEVNANNIAMKRFPKFDNNGLNVKYNVSMKNVNSALSTTIQPEFIEGDDGTFRVNIALKPLDITVHRIWKSSEQRATKIKLFAYVDNQPLDLASLGINNVILDMPVGVNEVSYHGLPRITSDGAAITYSVQELEESGNEIDLALYKVDYTYGKSDDGINDKYTVTNHKKYTVISIPNRKVSVHTISITKTNTKGEILNHSRFAIKSANTADETDIYNRQVANLVTDGEFSFTNSNLGFDIGTYYISEIAAPNGYQKLSRNLLLVIAKDTVQLDGLVLNETWQETKEYSVRLLNTNLGKRLELKVKNLKQFMLHLKKRVKREADQISSVNSDDYDSITRLQGAIFRLESLVEKNGAVAQTLADELAVGENGHVSFSNLVQGHYRLVETTVPEGYQPIEPIDFSIDENLQPTTTSENAKVFFDENNTVDLVVIVKNQEKNKDIKIFKVDGYNEKLNVPKIAQNIQFKVFASNLDGSINHQNELDFEAITNQEIDQVGGRDDIYSNHASQENGYPSGLYYLEEVRSASGYRPLPEAVPFYIESSGRLIIPAKRLDNGSYVKDNDRGYSNWFQTEFIQQYDVANRIGIRLTIQNPNKAADFKIKKVDNDDNSISLSDVHFEVYSSLPDGTHDRKLEEATTNHSGETRIFNNTSAKYTKGLYYLLETETKVGYQRIEKEIPFYVNSDSTIIIPAKKNEQGTYVQDVTTEYGNVIISSEVESDYAWGSDKVFNIITIGNKKKQANLKLIKTDFQDENSKLSQVGFQLYGDDMTTTIGEEKFTDHNGIVMFENLQIGTYYLQETTVKQGYLPNDKKYKIVVDEDGNVNNGQDTADDYKTDDYFVLGTMTDNYTMPIMVKNERIKKIDLKILKVDSKGNKVTTGSAQFQILRANKQLNETKIVNNITPIAHSYDGLNDVFNSGGAGYSTGLYYLHESEAPKGFIALGKPIPFYIDKYYKVYAPVKVNEHGEVEMQDKNGKRVPVIDTETYEFRNDVITYEKLVGYQYENDKILIVASIKNRREPLYPQTGGVGSVIFYLGGMLLMMIGAVLYQHRHYKNE